MSDPSSSADAVESPVASGQDEERGPAPTPRLATPATEATAESVQRERESVGDEPDVGGLTPPDEAQ